MKATNVKPLVTISTYEERQAELNKAIIKKDETDNSCNHNGNNLKTENDSNTQFPIPPPPPPKFSNSNGTSNLPENKSESPIETPTPDYDSTPTHTLTRNGFKNDKFMLQNGNNNSFVNKNDKEKTVTELQVGNELSKVINNGDIENESMESYKLQNPASKIPKPPSLYFASSQQNSGQLQSSSSSPTMKKTLNRNISVTIGEYGGQNFRKEPSKLDFISKVPAAISNDYNSNVNTSSSIIGHKTNCNNLNRENEIFNNKDENVSELLRSELVKTLSRSNLKKRNDSNSKFEKEEEQQNEITSSIPNGKTNVNNCNNVKNNNSLKNQFSNGNVEKLANLLQNRQKLYDNEIFNNNQQNKSATIKSANKVTITVPQQSSLKHNNNNKNHYEHRMVDSHNHQSIPPPPPPTNGILKSCYSKSSNFSEKSIKFGN